MSVYWGLMSLKHSNNPQNARGLIVHLNEFSVDLKLATIIYKQDTLTFLFVFMDT